MTGRSGVLIGHWPLAVGHWGGCRAPVGFRGRDGFAKDSFELLVITVTSVSVEPIAVSIMTKNWSQIGAATTQFDSSGDALLS